MPGPRLLLLLAVVLGFATPMRAESLRDAIDARVKAAWEKEKLTPAKPATDAEFLRRVYLDLVGTIPTFDETVAFLDDKAADKREKLVDRLLADARYAQQQTDLWDLLFFTRFPPGSEADKRDGFKAWLKTQFEKNTPYDVWVRELLQANGTSAEGGAMYYVQYRNAPEDATEAITQTFLGVQLQCARCHDHPFESWKQLDFYGVAAFLARLEVVTLNRKGGNMESVFAIGEHESGDIQFTGPAKDAVAGKKGEPVKPKFLLGGALAEPATTPPAKQARFATTEVPKKPKFSRKDKFAEWITAAENPYFARAITNRVWAQYMGRGVVHPVDNLSPANPPSIPELSELLVKEILANKFDLKWLTREIVLSKTYQLSSFGSGEPMPKLYQAARCRPLSAEELAASWRTAIGWTAPSQSKGSKSERFQPFESSYMIRFFGTPTTGTGDFQGGLQEHLYLNNGPIGQLINGKGTLSESIGGTAKPVEARVERLFLQTLNRRPTPAEAAKFGDYLKSGKPAGDAVWALVTSGEFRFNH